MAAKHSMAGLIVALDTWAEAIVGNAYKIGLFAANLTPDVSLADADYLTGGGIPLWLGYGTQALTAWAGAMADTPHARTTAATYTFTNADTANPGNVYGYVVMDAAEAVVIFAERDPAAPVVMGNTPGETYKVTPNLAIINE